MRERRHLIRTTTALAGATSLALLSGPAYAGTANLPGGGGTVEVTLDDPVNGAYAYGSDVPLAGQAIVNASPTPTRTTALVYTLDVSGSTVTTVTNGATQCLNPDGIAPGGTRLDCEITALVNLNNRAISGNGIGEVAAVAFAGQGPYADSTGTHDGSDDAVVGAVNPANLTDVFTEPGFRTAASGDPDVAVVLKSASNIAPTTATATTPADYGWGYRQFQRRIAPNGQTNYEAAVRRSALTANASTLPSKIVVMVSDGDATVGMRGLAGADTFGQFPTRDAFKTWVAAQAGGVKFVTFAIGAASCQVSDFRLGTLQDIADATGGSCTVVDNPANLPNVLPSVVETTLQGISARVDGMGTGLLLGGTLPAQPGTSVPFSTTLTGLAPGVHSVCAYATGRDAVGTATAQECRSVDVQAITSQPAFGGGASDVEGTPVPVSADLNGSATFAGWTYVPSATDPGATCEFGDPNALDTTVTCTDDGSFTLFANSVPTDRAASTLTLANAAPVVTTAAFTTTGPVFVGSDVTVTGRFTDAGANDSHTCVVDVAGGTVSGSVTEPAGGAPGLCSATFPVTAPGTLSATVRVTDDDLASGECSTAAGAELEVVDLTIDGGTGSGGGFEGVEGSRVYPHVTVPAGTTLSWTKVETPGDAGRTCVLGDADTASPYVVCDDDAELQLQVEATLNGSTKRAFVPVSIANARPSLSVPTFDTTGPVFPGTVVGVSASYTDAGANDSHTCRFEWNDGVTSTSPGASGLCSTSRALDAALEPYTATVTVTDDDGGSDVRSTTEGTTPSLTVRTVQIDPQGGSGGGYTGTEGSPVAFSATAPSSVALSWTAVPTASDPGASCSVADGTTSHPIVTCTDDGAFLVTVTASLGGRSQSASAPLQLSNANPVITSATPSSTLVPAGTSVTVTAPFTDAGSNDTHTCSATWDDGAPATTGTVTGGVCKVTKALTAVGVRTITVTVTDDDTGFATRDTDYVVVYDPNGGFVTGGGWVQVPAGALSTNPSATGRASFGLNSKYKKGDTVPTGSTEVQFQAGGVNFQSSAYQYLLVSGTTATYRGTGTVNGTTGFTFQVTVVDSGADGFRMQVWDSTGALLLDTKRGAADGVTQALSGGSVVIHAK